MLSASTILCSPHYFIHLTFTPFFVFQGLFNQLLNVYIKQRWGQWATLTPSDMDQNECSLFL